MNPGQRNEYTGSFYPSNREEATQRRYGVGKRHPNGFTFNPDFCAVDVAYKAQWNHEIQTRRTDFANTQCSKSPGHGPDGLFCARHSRVMAGLPWRDAKVKTWGAGFGNVPGGSIAIPPRPIRLLFPGSSHPFLQEQGRARRPGELGLSAVELILRRIETIELYFVKRDLEFSTKIREHQKKIQSGEDPAAANEELWKL